MAFEDDKREAPDDEPHLGQGGGVGEPHHQSEEGSGEPGQGGGDDEPHLGEGGGVGEPHHQSDGGS